MYCEACDDYGHNVDDHQFKVLWNDYIRLYAAFGDDWWIDQTAPPNGIGPMCLYCNRLIDWAPVDHGKGCPVPKFLGWETEKGN